MNRISVVHIIILCFVDKFFNPTEECVAEGTVLDVVLGKLRVVGQGYKLHARNQLYIALGKCLQL